MATPNYGYEKRQRELAKKKKKEDKLRAKAQRKPGDMSADQDSTDEPSAPASSADDAAADSAA